MRCKEQTESLQVSAISRVAQVHHAESRFTTFTNTLLKVTKPNTSVVLCVDFLSIWEADGNIQTCVLQLVLDSSDEDPHVSCTVSILDGGGAVRDTQVLQFVVQANSPGEVRTTDF